MCSSSDRPREWRRKVMVSVRLRSPVGWGDARIIDVSSRGMKIRASQVTAPGSTIELRKGEQTIRARVVWQQGGCAGLHSDSILPLGDLLCQDECEPGKPRERRDELRAGPRKGKPADSGLGRYYGRVIDGFAVIGFAGTLVVAIAMMAGDAVEAPMAAVEAALSPPVQPR